MVEDRNVDKLFYGGLTLLQHMLHLELSEAKTEEALSFGLHNYSFRVAGVSLNLTFYQTRRKAPRFSAWDIPLRGTR